MISRAAVSVATALAVAATVVGCSTTVEGKARSSSVLKSASVEEATPAVPQREWLDVTGQGVALPRDTTKANAQFSPVASAVPGIRITYEKLDGRIGGCTLGPAVTAGGRQGFLTAGHCALNAAGPQRLTGPDGFPVRELGLATEARFSYGLPDPSTGYAADSAAVWTATDSRASVMAGTWPVAGVLSAAEAQTLPTGAPVCFYGAVSGVACGPLLDARDPGGIHFGHAAASGDSGAAAFLVDGGGEAWLVGIMSSTDDDEPESTAALLAPALDRLGAEAITAR